MYDDLKALLPRAYQERAGQQLRAIGIDSPEHCFDPKRWYDHPPITYDFNSYGYRDHEWESADLWIIGDSFSMGLGQPYEETWPRQLEKLLNIRVNKVCCNGAGNDWIDAAYQLIRQQTPRIVIMWSFLYRQMKRTDDVLLLSGHEKLSKVKNLAAVEHHVSQRWLDIYRKYDREDVLFSFVPNWNQSLATLEAEKDPRAISYVMQDLARDGFHFGPQTSRDIARAFADKL